MLKVTVLSLLALCLLLVVSPAFGQLATGTMLGNVTDSTGAVVPGAAVTVMSWYASDQKVYPLSNFSASKTTFDVRMPESRMSGDMEKMFLKTSTPAGSVDLTMHAVGPVLYYNGGRFPFLGASSMFGQWGRLGRRLPFETTRSLPPANSLGV
jgi:hypothetical protein